MWLCGIYYATYKYIMNLDTQTAYKVYQQSGLPFVEWSDEVSFITGLVSLLIGAGFIDYLTEC